MYSSVKGYERGLGYVKYMYCDIELGSYMGAYMRRLTWLSLADAPRCDTGVRLLIYRGQLATFR